MCKESKQNCWRVLHYKYKTDVMHFGRQSCHVFQMPCGQFFQAVCAEENQQITEKEMFGLCDLNSFDHCVQQCSNTVACNLCTVCKTFARILFTSFVFAAIVTTGVLDAFAAHVAVHTTHRSWQPILSGRPLHPLTVPLSCGSGESSTGAHWVRYWEEPWDFLCFWAFLMDFLVNPSTFSAAEMADILMHKLAKTSHKRLYPPLGQMKGFLSCFSTVRISTKTLPCPKSFVLLCMIQHGRFQTLHHKGTACSPKNTGTIFKKPNNSWHCPQHTLKLPTSTKISLKSL